MAQGLPRACSVLCCSVPVSSVLLRDSFLRSREASWMCFASNCFRCSNKHHREPCSMQQSVKVIRESSRTLRELQGFDPTCLRGPAAANGPKASLVYWSRIQPLGCGKDSFTKKSLGPQPS